jgi:hypothetical protein
LPKLKTAGSEDRAFCPSLFMTVNPCLGRF